MAKFSCQSPGRHLLKQHVVCSGSASGGPVAAVNDFEIRHDGRSGALAERREQGDRLHSAIIQSVRFDEDSVRLQFLR